MKRRKDLEQSLLSESQQAAAEQESSSQLSNLPVIDGVNLFQRTLFTWLHPFLKHSNKEGVKVETMPSLPQKFQTLTQHQKIMNCWSSITRSKKQGWTIIRTLLKTYKQDILVILLLLIWMILLNMVRPFLTSFNIDYIQNHHDNLEYGIGLFFLTLVSSIFHQLSFSLLVCRFEFIGIQFCNSLNMMIYDKCLKYSTLANKKFDEAEIINYSQTDAQRLTYVGHRFSELIHGPIQLVFAFYMIYFYVGVSFFVGLSVVVILIIIGYFLSKRITEYNEKVLQANDQRMKVIEEMLSIIRFIKINAIEKFFFNKILQKREKQLGLYLKKGLLTVALAFSFWLTCPLLLSLTFITYVYMGNSLSPQVVFTVTILADILEQPIHRFPEAITELIQVIASLKRIEKFLFAEEIKNDLIVREQESKYAIRIQEGNFYWGKQKQKEDEKSKEESSSQKKIKQPQSNTSKKEQKDMEESENETFEGEQNQENAHVLRDISISIEKGKFVMIIGDIGSGKSSLLLAMLNQMIHDARSKIYLSGSIAYSPQKPWIISQTVKENIVFNLPFDEDKFNKAIYHSSFQHDLQLLPQGAQTEIGEEGINISGGQKARLSLARALYSDRDIYLLDDILSAVDVHVGDFLMKETLRGALKGKTIIMPTHALRYIEQADQIIIMKKGRVSLKGKFQQIRNRNEFREIFLKQAELEKQQEKHKKQQKGEEQIQEQIAKISEVFRGKKHLHDKDIGDSIQNFNEVIIQQLILPEDHKEGHVSLKIFKQFIQNCGGYFKFLVPAILCIGFCMACQTLSSIFLEKGCENSAGDSKELYLYVGFIILSTFFILIIQTITVFSSTKQGRVVHGNMIKSLLYASLSNFFNRVPVGRIVNRLTKDIREIDQDIVNSIYWTLILAFELLSILFICAYSSTALAFIPMIIVGILANQVRRYYMKTARQLARFQKSTNSPVVSGFMSSISGLSSIRAYKMNDAFLEAQMRATDTSKRVRLSKSGLENWFCNILGLLSFAVNMPCIAYCMLSDTSNPALMGLLMTFALSINDCIIGLILSVSGFETQLVSLERIYTFMNIKPEKDYKDYCLQWNKQEQGSKQVFQSGKIEFQNMSARYRKDLPNVLNSITCRIEPGEKVGIVGRTGAGKSTLINTLLRITDVSSGRIEIDGIDLQSFSLKDLRFSITMIDQEPTLIKSTFRENLDLTNQYTDEELQSILKECGLFDIITEKGGIDAMVSNTSLSAGEKQLLCICRAFLKRSHIVLIDQATANIDLKNDAIIQRVISEKFKQSTVLTIAHRLSTLKNSDKIMVLQKGSLIQFGDPYELENRVGGFYAEMLRKNEAQLLS